MTSDHTADLASDSLEARARRHLWLHFTRMSSYQGNDVPVIVRGSGQYVYDTRGKRYLDGLSGLFVSQIEPGRYKVLSREIAYHGTSMGALAVTGLPDIKAPFEPLPPGGVRVPNTNFYRAPGFVAEDVTAFGRWAADEIERAILREGPESVADVYLEPVQNSGGCFPPPPGYFPRVREICDRYGVLLVSDEGICAFGRLGYYFWS